MTALLTACEKEIDMEYKSIESKYVINSYTSSDQSSVTITRTTDMNDPMDLTPLTATSVTITDNQGVAHSLTQDTSGSYTSQSVIAQSAGEVFTLTVNIDDESFSSLSTVEPAPEILSMEFSTETIMNTKTMLLCTVTVSRDTDAMRYYKYELFLNGERLLWGSGNKETDAPNPYSLSMLFGSLENGVATANDDDETEINSGDEITVAVTALDARSYEYFETLSLSSQSNSNPVYNFSGGCLGYYTAYLNNSVSMPFSLD